MSKISTHKICPQAVPACLNNFTCSVTSLAINSLQTFTVLKLLLININFMDGYPTDKTLYLWECESINNDWLILCYWIKKLWKRLIENKTFDVSKECLNLVKSFLWHLKCSINNRKLRQLRKSRRPARVQGLPFTIFAFGKIICWKT